MNLIKTGRFIAEMRKLHKLTQVQLAGELCISDKTVSKWECGKGLPEVSLMLPLCERLGISVNDLLSGEKVTESNYQKKAEENMTNLMKENAENKRKFAVAAINGVITIIAVSALSLLAAYAPMPLIARVVVIAVAVLTGGFGIAGSVILDREAGIFECPHCNEMFVPSMGEYAKAYHTFTKRRLTCPKCKKVGMCKHRITR